MAMAIPLDNGGPPRRMCEGYCVPTWSPNGKFLFIAVEAGSQTNPAEAWRFRLALERPSLTFLRKAYRRGHNPA